MMTLAASAGGSPEEPIELEPGKAEFRVNVTLQFARKGASIV
jgi:hypothetical protein